VWRCALPRRHEGPHMSAGAIAQVEQLLAFVLRCGFQLSP
jgi:hypothetical protein